MGNIRCENFRLGETGLEVFFPLVVGTKNMNNIFDEVFDGEFKRGFRGRRGIGFGFDETEKGFRHEKESGLVF